MALYVSVVMWARLAIGNAECSLVCFFSSSFDKVISVPFQLSCYRTSHNLPFHQLSLVPKKCRIRFGSVGNAKKVRIGKQCEGIFVRVFCEIKRLLEVETAQNFEL